MAEVLAPLLELADVRGELTAGRAAVDRALRHPSLGRSIGPVAGEVGLRCAVASAALEGHRHPLDEVRAGTVTDPVVQGALRASLAVDSLAGLWPRAPRQALARLHVLAARGCPGVTEAELGRPVDRPGVAPRLSALCELITAPVGTVPALLRGAVVHGELLALGAFAGPNGVLARAAARLSLIADGLDPRGLLPLDAAHLAREPEYVGCSNAFATGTPDGVRAWIRHVATTAGQAADLLVGILDGQAT
jgi:hypothetical protein